MRIWEKIHEDLQDFGRRFARICKTLEDLAEDSQGFVRIWETGIGFLRICGTLGDFGRGFVRICKALCGFGRGFVRIQKI